MQGVLPSDWSCRWFGFALCAVSLVACGDDGPARMRDGGVADGGSAPDATVDAGSDSAVPETCNDPPQQTSLALAFAGDRSGGIDDFTSFGGGGPWLFAYRHESGDAQEIRALIADGTTDFGVTTVGVSANRSVRLGAPRVDRRAGNREVAIAWDRTSFDDEGSATGAEIRGVSLDDTGAPETGSNTMYQSAAAPRIASNVTEGFWLLRHEVAFPPVGDATPRLQQLDEMFAPSGPDVGLTAFDIPPEAVELRLRTTSLGVAFAYRVAPSTLFVVPFRADVGVGAAQRTFLVSSLDDFAVASSGAMAVVSTELVEGSTTVRVIALDALGREQGRATLDVLDGVVAPVRAAVAATSLGFAVVWRGTEGPAAELRVATVDFGGRVVTPQQVLANTPFLDGDVFLEPDGARLAVGYQSRAPSGEQRLGLVVACLP